MKKILCLFTAIFILGISSTCLADTSGKTDGRSYCEATISSNWMKKGGKLKVTICDNGGWNKRGTAYVDIYDEVGVKMKTEEVKGSKTISLPWTRHRFYVLKFRNAFSGADVRFYNSVKWKTDTVWGGNVKLQ